MALLLPSVPLTGSEVGALNDCNVRQIWDFSYEPYCASGHFQSEVQRKASLAILNCKSGKLGYNVSQCTDCGHTEVHNNSCRNRSCPNCQAVLTEVWVDERRAEVIDVPYFHVVFTLPHELNPLLLCNQKLLYNLLHLCSAETLLKLSADKEHLGATPGIIQVLHTWNQELGYHVHMHCIISSGGLTVDHKLLKSKGKFFIHVNVLRDKFRGKFLDYLDAYYRNKKLSFSSSCKELKNSYHWNEWKNRLYEKDWCPYIKETFNGFAMPSNTWDVIPTGLPFPITGSFPSQKRRLLFPPEERNRVSRAG